MELGPEQLSQMMERGEVQVVDVRQPSEREAGRIGGSRHIELPELAEAAETIDRDRPVVFYCRSGDRSAAAADAFAASGFDAASLAGGLLAWKEAGREVAGEVGHPSGLPPR